MAAVCVFCASSDSVDARYRQLAGQVGREIAARGYVLVSGGRRVGSMGAVARAARAAGGVTVGVIPRHLLGFEVADTDADELVVTATMRERKAEMDARSDAFLVLAGGLGTWEELLEIWTGRHLGMHDKPLVVLDPDGAFDGLRRAVDGLVGAGFARADVWDDLTWVRSAAEALDVVEAELAYRPAERADAADVVLDALGDR